MYLTVTEARKHLPEYPVGADFDDALRRVLEAAAAAIDERAGAAGNVTEWLTSSTSMLYPSRPVAAIVRAKEVVGTSELVLASNDYRIAPGGYALERLYSGTNPRTVWTGRVELVYSTTEASAAQREAVQILLVQQFLNYHPGLTGKTIGDWSEQFVANSVFNWAVERESILATLKPAGVVFA